MNSFTIKVIAIIAMVVDHVGYVFFPEELWMRIIGRLAFPLFCWLLAQGAFFTSNVYKYMFRLLLVGIVSQIIYFLLFIDFNWSTWSFNVFFTLLTGLIAIQLLKSRWNIAYKIPALILLLLISEMLKFEYGLYGVLIILVFYIFRNSIIRMSLSVVSITLIYFTIPLVLTLFQTQVITNDQLLSLIQPVSLFAIIIIASFNNKVGIKLKWLFYWFYPVHLLVLYVISLLNKF